MVVLAGEAVRDLVRRHPGITHPPLFVPDGEPKAEPVHETPHVLSEATAALDGVRQAVHTRLVAIAHPPHIENLEL